GRAGRGAGGRWSRQRDANGFRYAVLGSKRNFASVLSAGTRVGYVRVKQARQNSFSGLIVAAWTPSSEMYASEVAPICSCTSSTVRDDATSCFSSAKSIP